MSVRQCKFCGCTERRACLLIAVLEPGETDPRILAPNTIAIIAKDAETRLISCQWLLPDVCSNPACVEKAYAEAWHLADMFLEAA